MNTLSHARLPRYLRGVVGTITRINGEWQDPARAAAFSDSQRTKPVYQVQFRMTDLWQEYQNEADLLYADIWGMYLEPAGVVEER